MLRQMASCASVAATRGLPSTPDPDWIADHPWALGISVTEVCQGMEAILDRPQVASVYVNKLVYKFGVS